MANAQNTKVSGWFVSFSLSYLCGIVYHEASDHLGYHLRWMEGV